jgi:hypothetical protein
MSAVHISTPSDWTRHEARKAFEAAGYTVGNDYSVTGITRLVISEPISNAAITAALRVAGCFYAIIKTIDDAGEVKRYILNVTTGRRTLQTYKYTP